MNPVKLFIHVPTADELAMLIQHCGEPDHRSSILLSFERLIDTDELKEIPALAAPELEFGYVDNRHVFRTRTGVVLSEAIMEFKNGGIVIHPSTDACYRSAESQEFFLKVRQSYRSQLRRMCVLRRIRG